MGSPYEGEQVDFSLPYLKGMAEKRRMDGKIQKMVILREIWCDPKEIVINLRLPSSQGRRRINLEDGIVLTLPLW
jgi:hypothetical protein